MPGVSNEPIPSNYTTRLPILPALSLPFNPPKSNHSEAKITHSTLIYTGNPTINLPVLQIL